MFSGLQQLINLITPAEKSVVLGLVLARGVDALGVLVQALGLLGRNAEGLGSHARGALLHLNVSLGVVLDGVFAGLYPAERGLDEVALLQSGAEVFPLFHNGHVGVQETLGLREHVRLDGVKQVGDFIGGTLLLHGDLLSGVTADCHVLAVLDISGPDLHADGDTLELPMVELPAWRVVLSGVDADFHAALLQSLLILITDLKIKH